MSVQEFYNKNPFPGPYTFDQLSNYDVTINPYVKVINHYIDHKQKVLDVGCGTGLLTNLFALRYASGEFQGLDFSTGADYASDFAKQHSVLNAKFVKQNFFDYSTTTKFDIIIAQSFITHVSNYIDAVDKIKQLLKPNGIVIIGVYNNWGNCIKNLLSISYNNKRLELDQTANPCEIALTHREVLNMFNDYELLEVTPSINNKLVNLANLFNARNGGLTLYVFKGLT